MSRSSLEDTPGYYSSALHQIREKTASVPQSYSHDDPDLRERLVPSVKPPATHTPNDQEFYVPDVQAGVHRPNVRLLRDHFFDEGRLTEPQALFILEQTTTLLTQEPNMLQIDGPVTVCGDIHGQYYDLMKIFDVGGSFAETSYLFLGDYVDRGYFSIECLLYLYALKLWYPDRLFLLRGNHECRHLTEYFTFKRECLHKYSATVYEACIRSFQALPISALLDGKFFCVHGGISPELMKLSDIDKVDRFVEPASVGLLCDLLWSDPMPGYGEEHKPTYERPHGVAPGTTFEPNHTRGCSFYFTYEAACQFLERNHLLGIFRGHEAQDAGYCMSYPPYFPDNRNGLTRLERVFRYTMHRKTPTKKFPSLITVFSAPNYLDAYHNRGAIIRYKDKSMTIRQYNATSHPYWLPNFMDAFTWSLPFVGAKITEMLLAILAVCSDHELEEASHTSSEEDEDRARTLAEIEEDDEDRAHPSERRQEIKNKILAVGKMQRVFQLLRQEAESATELNPSMPGALQAPGAWPGGFAPPTPAPDALGVQTANMRRYIRSFDDARRSDIANERLPHYAPALLPFVPVPSMRLPGLGNGEEGHEEQVSMEVLIRHALEEEGLSDGGVVERLAERIARGRRSGGRPRGLKRFETAP